MRLSNHCGAAHTAQRSYATLRSEMNDKSFPHSIDYARFFEQAAGVLVVEIRMTASLCLKSVMPHEAKNVECRPRLGRARRSGAPSTV